MSVPKQPQGGVLPDRTQTPGVINLAVTQSNIHSTICVSGWTATVRPAARYTSQLKRSQLANGYTYNGDTDPANYEEDHLIPLELGGSPADPRNLWPEPSTPARYGSKDKDALENTLHALVCADKMSLIDAQNAIANNWILAYGQYNAH